MSRAMAAACFIGVIVMPLATLGAGPARESLRVGDRLPVLKGQFLSGRDAELHDRVITVYKGTGEWKKRLAYSAAREDDVYLIVVDRDGIVRWLHRGGFDQARADDLRALLTSLADGRTTIADHDLAHRRSEP